MGGRFRHTEARYRIVYFKGSHGRIDTNFRCSIISTRYKNNNKRKDKSRCIFGEIRGKIH